MPLTLITGPVRSGKSRFAEELARASGEDVTYLATARRDPGDAEWVARIAHHAARRPPTWRTIETATAGAPSLLACVRAAQAGQAILVDSLGTWLADRFAARLAARGDAAALDAADLEAESSELAGALLATPARAIVVGEEVGWGIVPPYPAGRVFRDVLGRTQARLAGDAAHAYLVVAGYAIDLRRAGTRVAGA